MQGAGPRGRHAAHLLGKKLLSSQDVEQGVRLACQAQVKGPAQVTLLAPTAARHHILEEGIGRAVRLQPALKKHFLPVERADWKKKGPLAGMIQELLGRAGVRRAILDVSDPAKLRRRGPGRPGRPDRPCLREAGAGI